MFKITIKEIKEIPTNIGRQWVGTDLSNEGTDSGYTPDKDGVKTVEVTTLEQVVDDLNLWRVIQAINYYNIENKSSMDQIREMIEKDDLP